MPAKPSRKVNEYRHAEPRLLDADDISDVHEIRRSGHRAPVDQNMAMAHQMTSDAPRDGKARTKHDIVQPPLNQRHEVLRGGTRFCDCFCEITLRLLFGKTV